MVKHACFCFFLLFIPAAGFTQMLPSQFYTTHDGLPSNQINALYQDSRGYLWIGTNSGLSVYDGETFTNYSIVDGLPNNWITSIAESRKEPGVLWIGTIAGGISRLESNRFIQVETGNNDRSKIVSSVMEDSRGILWSMTVDGTYRHHYDSSEIVLTRISNRYSNKMAESENGLIWVGRGNMVTMLDPDGTELKSLELNPDNLIDVTGMALIRDGRILVGTSDSLLYAFQDTSLISMTKLESGVAQEIAEDEQGNIWVRSAGTVARLSSEPGRFVVSQRYAIDDLIPSSIWAGPMIIDREGILWIGTWTNGLMKVTEKNAFRLPMNVVQKGFLTGKKNLIFFTPAGLTEVYTGSDGSLQVHIHQNFRNEDFSAIILLEDNPGRTSERLWIQNFTATELYGYKIQSKPGHPSVLSHSISLKMGEHYSRPYLSITADTQNRLWLGSDIVEVVDLNTGKILREFTVSDGLPGESTRVLFHDGEGFIWAGDFDQGLAVMDIRDGLNGNFVKFTVDDGLPDNRIRAVHRDSDGHLWFGTRHGGLVRYRDRTFETISMNDGLMSNTVWHIFGDERDRLWLFTDYGVECIERASLKVLPFKRIPGERLLFAGYFAGRHLFLVSPSGLILYDQSNVFEDNIPPLIHIKSVEINGRAGPESDDLKLKYSENNIAVHFAGLSFRDEKRIRHQYRLLGLDSVWSASTSQRSITYAALRPGNYTFEAKALNVDGVESISPASVTFRIARPYWQEWWFISFAAVLFALMLWAVYRYQVNRILEMERLRVRIAGDLHDDVGTNLSSILILSQIMHRQAVLSDRDSDNLTAIETITANTQGMLRDIVWMLNPKNDTVDDMILRMKELAGRLLQNYKYRFIVPQGQLPEKVSIEFKRNIFLIFKEALNNIVKHASATEVEIEVWQKDGIFHMKITDNGQGFDQDISAAGNGLENFHRRARQIKGYVRVDSAPGRGTVIDVSVKNHPNV